MFTIFLQSASPTNSAPVLLFALILQSSGCYDHPLVVFATNPSAPQPTFWIAAIDPPGCGDGDCNLTLVKVNSSGYSFGN